MAALGLSVDIRVVARVGNIVIAETNAALNLQSRRVLAQHYRAKYGVK